MSVVYYTIADGVCDRRVADYLVPVLNWQLGDEDGRFSSMSVLEYFEQCETVLGSQGLEAEIVDYDDIEFLHSDKFFEIASVYL